MTQDEAQLRQSAEAGDVAAMMALADLLYDRYDPYAGDEEALEEVLEWYRRAAEAGDVEGMHALGTMLFSDGDEEEAQPWLQRAADAGHAGAMYELGNVFDFLGESDQALHWYQRAAEAGSSSGARNYDALKKELADKRQRP